MADIYWKTAGMVLMIGLGYFSKYKGLLTTQDAQVLSKLVIYITLPSVIVQNLNGLTMSFDMGLAVLLGILSNLLLVMVAWAMTRKGTNEMRYVYLFSLPLFNISGYAVPVAQVFLSEREVGALLLFNLPTTVFTYILVPAFVTMQCNGERHVDWRALGQQLRRSVPAMTSVFMIFLSLSGLEIPERLIQLLSGLSASNTFLAMLSIGLLFQPSYQRSGTVVNVVVLRLVCVSIMALTVYLGGLPFGELRSAMVLVLFAPMVSTAPAMALTHGYRGGEVALCNSCYLPISVLLMAVVSGILIGK